MKKLFLLLSLLMLMPLSAAADIVSPKGKTVEQVATEINNLFKNETELPIESSKYDEGMLQLNIRKNSDLNKIYWDCDFDTKLIIINKLVLDMFTYEGEDTMLDLLENTRTSICYRFPIFGSETDYAEHTVWPGDARELFRKKAGKSE